MSSLLFCAEKAASLSEGARDELFFNYFYKKPLTWTEEACVYKLDMATVLFEGLMGTPASAWAIVGILSIDYAMSDTLLAPISFVTD